MSKLRSRTNFRLCRAGIVAGGITGLLLVGTAVPAFAAVPGTLSVSSGPSGGGNTLTLTTAAGTTPFSATPAVEFQAVTASSSGCSTSYKNAANVTVATTTPYTSTAGVVIVPVTAPGNPTKLTANKVVIPVPTTAAPAGVALVGSQSTSRFYVCAYDTTSTTASVLLASATYSIAAQPTLATVAPTSGVGGNTVTITGTGFISGATTVTIGGVAATNVVVTGGTSLTATVPFHAPSGPQNVAVTTTGGTVTNAAINGPGGAPGTLTGFSYTNGITVSPNTSPSNTNPALDISGSGFSSLTWAGDLDTTGIAQPGGTSTGSRILLTDNNWYNGAGQAFGAGGGSVWKNTTTTFPVAQCGSILPIADGEVICTLDLAEKITFTGGSKFAVTALTPVPDGTYQITVANSDAANALTSAASNYSVLSSGSTFTVSSF